MPLEDIQIEAIFVDAVRALPSRDIQEQALTWLAKRTAAYTVISEIEERGIEATLFLDEEERLQ